MRHYGSDTCLDWMGDGNNCSLRHCRVQDQGRFHLCRADAMPGNIDDVIHTARDPVVAVLGGVRNRPRESREAGGASEGFYGSARVGQMNANQKNVWNSGPGSTQTGLTSD